MNEVMFPSRQLIITLSSYTFEIRILKEERLNPSAFIEVTFISEFIKILKQKRLGIYSYMKTILIQSDVIDSRFYHLKTTCNIHAVQTKYFFKIFGKF